MEDINKYIDFNCNLNEFQNFAEDETRNLIDYVSSIEISSELINGSALHIKKIINECKSKNKVIGAALNLPNENINIEELSEEEIESIVLYQIGALSGFAKANNLNIEFVRPSGIMYSLAAQNLEFSTKIARAIKKYSKWILYYGAAGNIIEEVSENVKINIVKEINLNKTYNKNGSINFEANPLTDYGQLLIRLRRLMNLKEIEISEQNYAKFDFDSIHLSPSIPNILNLMDDSKSIVIPRPYNYNKADSTGWVGINRNHYAQEINFEKNNK